MRRRSASVSGVFSFWPLNPLLACCTACGLGARAGPQAGDELGRNMKVPHGIMQGTLKRPVPQAAPAGLLALQVAHRAAGRLQNLHCPLMWQPAGLPAAVAALALTVQPARCCSLPRQPRLHLPLWCTAPPASWLLRPPAFCCDVALLHSLPRHLHPALPGSACWTFEVSSLACRRLGWPLLSAAVLSPLACWCASADGGRVAAAAWLLPAPV